MPSMECSQIQQQQPQLPAGVDTGRAHAELAGRIAATYPPGPAPITTMS